MLSFLFRLAGKAALVQRYRFVSLALTIAIASTLLLTLSTLYLNAESQLAMELSGVPNLVVETEESMLAEKEFNTSAVLKLKSQKHFWRNNILNAAPISRLESHGKEFKLAATWFSRNVTLDNESYSLGILEFEGWSYSGRVPKDNQVIVGENVPPGEELTLKIQGEEKNFEVAGVVSTGSYWDDYVFLNFDSLESRGVDKILVGALIKPKDQLAVKAEKYGEESLSKEEFESWYCSPYASSIAYTIEEVLPGSEVEIQRRITEVQEGIIEASSKVFVALLALTLVAALLSIFSAERMYISAKRKEVGIMNALGASENKILLNLFVEISLGALISIPLSYGASKLATTYASREVFGIAFEAEGALIALAFILPFAVSLAPLLFARKALEKEAIEDLRW